MTWPSRKSIAIVLASLAAIDASALIPFKTEARNDLGPVTPGSYMDGLLRIKQCDFDAGIAILQSVSKKPDPPDGIYADIGFAYCGKRDFKNAELYYNKALALALKNGKAKNEQELLARVYLERGRMYVLSDRLPEAAESYEKSVQYRPADHRDTPGVMRELADVYEKQHRWAACLNLDTATIAKYQKQLKSGRETEIYITRTRGQVARILYQRARCERVLGKPDQATRDDADANRISDEI